MNSLEFGILFPAFLAGLLVLATHVPMGQQVLNRGIVFIDLAIAQVADLVTAASTFGSEAQGWRQAAAGRRAVGRTSAHLDGEEMGRSAGSADRCAVRGRGVRGAVAGQHPGRRTSQRPAGGQIWVSAKSLIPIAILAQRRWWLGSVSRPPRPGRFYVLFALVVTQSVQLVGIYLVFASLIIPPWRAPLCGRYAALGGICRGPDRLCAGVGLLVTVRPADRRGDRGHLAGHLIGAVILSLMVPQRLRAA
jgi:zinc/manganese transport system permease protein